MNTPNSQIPAAGDDIITRLTEALKKDGDFPASAAVVNKLKELTKDPRASSQQVAEVILTEPSLSTRILHLVNSAMYRRSKTIMTVSQAVVAVGMKSIAELCAGVILLQRFIPAARNGGAFADCFKKSMVTSLLSSSFSESIVGTNEGNSSGNELGYISGFFSEIGTMLLAYYFPKIYDSAVQRAKQKGISIADSLHQITGHSPTDLSVAVIQALGLPSFYCDVVRTINDKDRLNQENIRSLEETKLIIAARSVGAGYKVSAAIAEGNKEGVDKALSEVSSEYNLEFETVGKALANLQNIFSEHCSISEIQLPSLPEFLHNYSSEPLPISDVKEIPSTSTKLISLIDEIRQAVDNHESTATVITATMEALKFGLQFDRVLLMLLDPTKKNLVARMGLGIEGFKVGMISVVFTESASSSAVRCLKESRPLYQGEPLLLDGWPVAFIPIGNTKRGPGIIYADKKDQTDELPESDKATISVITNLLEKSLSRIK